MFDNETDAKAYYTQLCYDANPMAIRTELEKAYKLDLGMNFDYPWYVALLWGQGDKEAMFKIYEVAKSL